MGPKKFDVSMLRLDTFYHKDGSWKNLAQDSQSSLAPEYIYVYIYIYILQLYIIYINILSNISYIYIIYI